MIVKQLYRYARQDGGVTVSPEKPQCEYVDLARLIADDGKLLTQDGVSLFGCVDINSIDGWYEVEIKE